MSSQQPVIFPRKCIRQIPQSGSSLAQESGAGGPPCAKGFIGKAFSETGQVREKLKSAIAEPEMS